MSVFICVMTLKLSLIFIQSRPTGLLYSLSTVRILRSRVQRYYISWFMVVPHYILFDRTARLRDRSEGQGHTQKTAPHTLFYMCPCLCPTSFGCSHCPHTFVYMCPYHCPTPAPGAVWTLNNHESPYTLDTDLEWPYYKKNILLFFK